MLLSSLAFAAGWDPAATIPLDPGVHAGVLANGLRWYVEPNGTPAARAELRLVVDAGSVLEDDDQRGLAHVLLHMAFNGSRRFAEGELVAWAESVGTRFGAHLNAWTSFDETTYRLTLPSIERERGVVLEEWRRGLGAAQRVGEEVRAQLWGDSPYARRLPIGTEASIRAFTPEGRVRLVRVPGP